MRFYEKNPSIDISGGYLKAFGDDNRVLKCPLGHIDILLTMMNHRPLYHPNVILKKDVIYSFNKLYNVFSVYDKNYIYAGDYKLWTMLAEKKYRFGNISEILVNYRISDNQVTCQKWKEMRCCTFKIQNEYIEYITRGFVKNDENLYDYINNTIESYNTNDINFIELKKIICNIYSNILDSKSS